jgi:ketosteroid isomerase-like protein
MNDSNNASAAIDAATRRFLRLFALNDAPGVAACYTEDAQMLVANMSPIHGAGHTLEFQQHELEVHDATAIAIGRYVRRRGDGTLFDDGKYMVVWKRVGAQWKIHRDMFSTSLPKAVTPAAEWKAA